MAYNIAYQIYERNVNNNMELNVILCLIIKQYIISFSPCTLRLCTVGIYQTAEILK
jgi:hypothetical protein